MTIGNWFYDIDAGEEYGNIRDIESAVEEYGLRVGESYEVEVERAIKLSSVYVSWDNEDATIDTTITNLTTDIHIILSAIFASVPPYRRESLYNTLIDTLLLNKIQDRNDGKFS